MGSQGFICFDGYLKRTERLTDEELGRLFRACMVYHATGEVIELDGRESVAFDFIREDMDVAAEKYAAKCESNRANVQKRWENERTEKDTTVYERIRPYTTVCEAVQDDTNAVKQNKNKNNNYIDVDVDTRACEDTTEEGQELFRIQREQDQVIEAAENAGFPKNEATRARLVALYAEHGKQKMMDAINACVNHSASSIAYLQGVLRGEPKARKPTKGKMENERDYSREQDAAMARMIHAMGGTA